MITSWQKIANVIELSFGLSEEEKQNAALAEKGLEQVSNLLVHAKEYLNVLGDPLKQAADLNPEAVFQYRAAIRKFADQIKENYEKAKVEAAKTISYLDLFSSDTNILELIHSFKDSIKSLEIEINTLLEDLDDLRDLQFKDKIVKDIENIQKQSQETEELIKDRLISYLNANILTKDWDSVIREKFNLKVQENAPYISQLLESRQQALKNLG